MGARSVVIRGDGVAAYTCAHLLNNAGFRVSLETVDRPRVPVIMLSDAALALMRDVFGRPELLTGLPRIEQRVVVWGKGAATHVLAHAAAVVSEKVLLKNLGAGLQISAPAQDEAPAFTVYTSKPLPAGTAEENFGSRRASAAQVTLRDEVDQTSCRIESLDDGWLFLIPNAAESTWLLAIGAPLESLLAQSREIAARIKLPRPRPGEFATCPRIAVPLGGPGWIACGSAAMAFDPICGDGTAQAIREAILASAVIRATADGGDAESLYSHYEMRLLAGMQRHLAMCAEFYRSGGDGAWWQEQLAALADGFRWCGDRLRGQAPPRYRLQGFELVLGD